MNQRIGPPFDQVMVVKMTLIETSGNDIQAEGLLEYLKISFRWVY